MISNNLTDKQLNFIMDLIDQSIDLVAKNGDHLKDTDLILQKLAIVEDILKRDVLKSQKSKKESA